MSDRLTDLTIGRAGFEDQGDSIGVVVVGIGYDVDNTRAHERLTTAEVSRLIEWLTRWRRVHAPAGASVVGVWGISGKDLVRIEDA